MPFDPRPNDVHHKLHEDLLAVVMGTGLVALGVVFYTKATLSTGSTAGLAFVVHYLTGIGFGPVFFAINLPFYLFALLRMGLSFTVRSFISVSLVSFFAALFPHLISLESIDPVFAALTGGALMGFGILVLFRHKASLGGVNIVALYLQDNFGWRAGYVQLAVDACVLASAFLALSVQQVLLSMLGAFVLNIVIALNHRPGRYMGVS